MLADAGEKKIIRYFVCVVFVLCVWSLLQAAAKPLGWGSGGFG